MSLKSLSSPFDDSAAAVGLGLDASCGRHSASLLFQSLQFSSESRIPISPIFCSPSAPWCSSLVVGHLREPGCLQGASRAWHSRAPGGVRL